MNNNKAGGLKFLLIAHVEKLVVAGLVGVAGYLAYAALGVESYTKQPAQLTQQITRSRDAIRQATWASSPEENRLEAFDPNTGSTGPVPAEAYAPKRGWSRPVVPPTISRPDPTLLAATDVEGIGVTGLMAFTSEAIRRERELEAQRQAAERQKALREGRDAEADRGPRGGRAEAEADPNRRPAGTGLRRLGQNRQALGGDELIRRVSCAVVLALAPLEAQSQAYRDALENARGYDAGRDSPRYIGYFVERAEVRGGETGEWIKVRVTDGQGGRGYPAMKNDTLDRVLRDWAVPHEPLMDPTYEDPLLTTPLAPLAGDEWPVGVVHSKIPLMAETLAKEAELMQQEEDALDGPALDQDDADFTTRPGIGGDRRGGGMRAQRPRGGGGMRGGPMRGGPMRGGMGPMMGGMDEGMGGMRGGARPRGVRPRGADAEPVEHLMVRFFDFGVTPGRQYRYRVRLVVGDVNHPSSGVSPTLLAPEVATRIDAAGARNFRLADWSEPGSVVSVPMAGDAYLASAKPPRKGQPKTDATVRFLVESYSVDDEGRAIRAAIEEAFRIGGVMNLTEDAEVLSADQRWIEKVDNFEFRTGVTLCDFLGGEPISRAYTTPVRALLMDAAGRLGVRHQLDSVEAIENHKLIFEEDAGNRRGGPGPAPGGRGGGEDLFGDGF